MDLTKKVGPMPMWAWGAAGLGAALAYSLISRAKASKDSSADSDTATATTVPADQIPDFINQVTVNNPAGPGPVATAPPSTPSTPTAPPVAPPKTTTPAPPSTSKPAPAKAISYKVKSGDTLSSIAKRYGTTWQSLWSYNTTSGNRPADTIKTLKSRGPNLLYAGETILIPSK